MSMTSTHQVGPCFDGWAPIAYFSVSEFVYTFYSGTINPMVAIFADD